MLVHAIIMIIQISYGRHKGRCTFSFVRVLHQRYVACVWSVGKVLPFVDKSLTYHFVARQYNHMSTGSHSQVHNIAVCIRQFHERKVYLVVVPKQVSVANERPRFGTWRPVGRTIERTQQPECAEEDNQEYQDSRRADVLNPGCERSHLAQYIQLQMAVHKKPPYVVEIVFVCSGVFTGRSRLLRRSINTAC